MKKLIISLLLATFAIIALCAAEDNPIHVDKPRAALKPIRTIPPIIIDPSIFCLLFPLPDRCNPCKYGQPIRNVTCGQGQRRCAANGGTCKINQYDRAYCCPNEHPGCCPLVVSSPVIIGRPSFCFPPCITDAQCRSYQKCCGSCRRCVNAILT
ncbi:unnamed protein product [Rotaria sp. Silwood2]|nr:unnamed protein product [Rotaria sp. Silwood2]CAF2773306.1 unnamed protein product [Rotaria sp. Silwood2]CAF3032325.1 unnamed protein product [Rotaria sp. Silwood2]CAF3179447.1 unnamed protein product [Rotaria sp. Silwood2]CAF3914604.1 unnamed protein product [Rotaria sp. Silwood2]